MTKPRVIETYDGIQDKLTVDIFDSFARGMRDKGWNNVDSFIRAGINGGHALEIGPGPGYVGLEWLKKTTGTQLTGCEISQEMIRLAQKNAAAYGFENRVTYVHGNCMAMPFDDASFDTIFSNGSLHEWEDPVTVFNEICRVLKPGGLYCITDMRRDVNPLIKKMIYNSTKPVEIKPGFLSSYNASYTADEIKVLLKKSALIDFQVQNEFFGLSISGKKR